MEKIERLTEEEVYTYNLLLNAKRGMFSPAVAKAYKELSDKFDKIEDLYYTLYYKEDRTPEEEEIFQTCFKSLILDTIYTSWGHSDARIIEIYESCTAQAKFKDAGQALLRAALTYIIKEKGIQVPDIEIDKYDENIDIKFLV